jgi:branched-subunit amino acid ABC-type transport system permease component
VSEFLSTLPGGLVTGAVYALLAMGLVFIYKATRVPNFAYGAVAALVAFFHYDLVSGRHFGVHLNVFFVHLNLGWTVRLPFWVAIFVSLAFAGVLGFVIERFIMRAFARTPMVTQMIVTLGLTGILSALAQQWFGAKDLIVPNERAIFPRRAAFALGSVNMSYEQLGVIGLVLAFGAVLYWFFRFTETGLAIRAVATDRDVASLQGISVRRLSTISWVGGSAAAGMAGIMLASLVVSSNPSLLVLLSIKGFAAAIVGGMISFPVAVTAGFGIGVGEEIVRHYIGRINPTAFVGAPEILTLGAVIVILAMRPPWIFKGLREEEESGVVSRGAGVDLPIARFIDPVEAYRLARAATGRIVSPRVTRVLRVAIPIGLGLFVLAFPFLPFPDFWTFPMNLTLIYLLVVLSFVVLVGWLGKISLALGAFVAVGGVGAAIGANYLHLPFPFPILCGVLFSIPVSILVGLPGLRLRGMHFAVVTLAFTLAAERALVPRLGASTTLTRPDFLQSDTTLYYVFLVCTALAFAFAWRISSTRTGRAFRAVRDSETVAVAYGIQLVRTKLTGFVVSGAIASLAGVLIAYLLGSVQTGAYADVGFSITWLLNSVVSGVTSIVGPVIGALFFGLLPELSKGEVNAAAISFWPQVTAGALLIFIMAFNPEGLASMARFLRTRVSAHAEDKDEDLKAIESAHFGEPGGEPAATPKRKKTLVGSKGRR